MVKFDEQHYLFLYEDVKKSKFSALEHWLVWGRYEGREAKFVESKELHSKIPVEKDTISVVISLHGDKPDLRAINSIINQTYKNIEIVLVCSRESNFNDKRIKLIESNEWMPAKRYNLGLLQCKGEFVCFMFNNSEWLPNCIETLFTNIKNDMQMVSAQVDFVNYRQEDAITFGQALTAENYSHVSLPNNAVMLRRTLFEELGYFDESSEFIKAEDHEMWSRVHYNNLKVGFIPKVVGRQYLHSAEDIIHLDKKMAYANLILRYNCFNEKFYLSKYADVKGAVDAGMFRSGLDHFLNFGYKEFRLICNPEGRKPSL